MEKVRLGIIGMGNIGSTHLQNWLKGRLPEITVSAIADLIPERLDAALAAVRKAGAELENAKTSSAVAGSPDAGVGYKLPLAFPSGDELIDSGEADAVLVAVPHYDHPRFVIKALRHGCHVMCEKPAGVYTLQVRDIIAEANRHPRLVFGMMFNQRTNCVYRKMREIIKSGELGEIRRTSWIITDWYRPQYYYDSGDWRATWSGEGGGVLLNQAPHNLDLWQWICGMPSVVEARMKFGRWHDIEVEDDVTAYCEYPNGATGTFITSTGDFPGTNRFEVVCDGGTLVCDKKSLTLHRLDTDINEYSRTNRAEPFGHPECESGTPQTDGKNEQHAGVLNAFAGAVLRGEPLVADGREGINALTISNAMHLSAWTGRSVSIPFDERLFLDELKERINASSVRKVTSSVLDVNNSRKKEH